MRIVDRNEREKRMDVDREDLSEGGKKARKIAKKTTKSLRNNKPHEQGIMKSILETEGVTSSQVSAYVRGEVKNKKGEPYSSQNHVKCYRNGHQTDSDDSD